MAKGLIRFEYYLQQLEVLIGKAKQTPDPAEFLYRNDARTICFMLESLARLYVSMHNKKRFTKMKEHFKMLEDAMGDIDHYDTYLKEWHDYPNFPQAVHIHLQNKYTSSLQQLNDILLNEYWMSETDNRIEKFRKKLQTAGWLSPKKEIKAIKKIYEEAIQDIEKFVESSNGSFTQIEEQVHELRRDLRWLSIYAKSLQGAIQLSNSAVSDENLQPYLTEEVIHSPHNTLPPVADNSIFLLLEKKYFLALSWMISKLGELKDEGLHIMALTEAIAATEAVDEHTAQIKALQLLNKEPNTDQVILTNAEQICGDYFNNKMLQKLIKGIAEKKK